MLDIVFIHLLVLEYSIILGIALIYSLRYYYDIKYYSNLGLNQPTLPNNVFYPLEKATAAHHYIYVKLNQLIINFAKA